MKNLLEPVNLIPIILLACLAFAGSVQSAEISRANNTTALNLTGAWSGGVVPGSGDLAVWGSDLTTSRSSVIGANLSFSGIRISTTNASATLMTIGATTGANLTLGSDGITITGTSTSDLRINSGLIVGAAQTWSVGATRSLTITTTTGNFTGSSALTLTGAGTLIHGSLNTQFGTGPLTLEGGIRIRSDGATGRTIANDLVLNGDVGMGGTTASGALSLTGNMSVTGPGTRTISLQNSSGNDSANSFTLGATSKRITGDGTLALVNGNPSGAIRATLTSVIDVNLSIGSNVTATVAATDVLTSNASVQVDGRMRLGNNGSAAYNQTIRSLSGNGFVDSGQGLGTAVATLTIDGGAGTGSSNFTGVIENGSFGSVAVVKSGSNTQVFSGTNTYTGTTTVNGGVLQFAKATSLYAGTEANWTAAKIIVNSGGTLAFNVGNSASGEFTSGNITTILSNLTGSSSSATTGMKSGSAFGFDTTNADGGSFTISGVVRNGNSNGNQTVGLTKLGSGTLVLSGTNTYNGTTTISVGTLSVSSIGNSGASSNVGNGSTINIGSAGSSGTLLYTGAAQTTNRTISLSGTTGGATLDQSGSGLLQFTSNISSTAAGNKTLTLQGSTAGTGEISGVVSDFGASNTTALVKAGSGTWTLSANNTYSGGTTLSAGTLNIGHANALGTSGTISLGGGTLQYGTGITTDLSSRFSTAANQTYNIDTGINNVAYASALTSSGGALVKNGSGMLTLSNAGNTYSGATTINAGTIQLTGSISSSAVTINSGATLAGNGTAGAVTINSGGIISPGNSPGTITVGNSLWEGGGNYNWQLYNSAGSAGTGWDFISSAGSLTLNATSGNKFNINLWSLSGINPDANGNALNFNASTSTSWNIASFAGGISGFSTDIFHFNTAATSGTGGFTASGQLGAFSITSGNNTLTLVYTAPSAAGVWVAGTGNWSTAANWQGNAVPSNADPIEFAGSGGTSTNDSALISVNGLTFTASASGSYTVNGSALEIATGGILNSSSHTQTVGLDLTMSAASTINAATADLTITGGVDNDGSALTATANANRTISISGVVSDSGALIKNGSGTLILTGNNSYGGTTTISAGTLQIGGGGTSGSLGTGEVVADAALVFNRSDSLTVSNTISGSGFLVQNGSGLLMLTGNNTYSGGTVVNSGTLAINHASAIGSGTLTLHGGSLDNTSGAAITLASNNSQAWNGDFTFTGTNDLDLGTGAVSMNASRSLTVTAGNLTVGGVVSGSGYSLTKAGAGTLVLSGNNTYSGGTTISAGTLQIGSGGTSGSLATSISNNATLVFNRSNSLTVSDAISGSGVLVQNGSGLLTLSVNNTYTGGTTLNAGTLNIGAANALGSSGNITFGGGTLQYGIANATDISARVKNSSSAILIDTNANNVTFAGSIDSTNVGGLTKNGTGTLTLSASNSYTGTTTINAGTLSVGNATAFGNGSYAGNIVNSGTLLFTAANQILAGVISGGGLIQLNAGEITLSGDNTFTGNLIIGGRLSIASSSNLGGNGTLQLGRFSAAPGLLSYTGNSTTIHNAIDLGGTTASATLEQNGTGLLIFTNNFSASGAGSKTLFLQGNGTAEIAGSLINNSVSNLTSLTKNGSGTWILSGANTYTGTTTINAGTLQIGAGGATGSIASSSIVNNAALLADRTGMLTLSGNISGSGTLTKNGSGTLVLSGSNTYSGATTLNLGTITLQTSNAIGSSALTQSSAASLVTIDTTGTLTNTMSLFNVAATQSATLSGGITVNNATFDVDSGDTLTLSGSVGGSGSITKNGSGALVLSGSNSYLGATTVNAGPLQANHASALGSNTTVTVNGGSLLVGSDDAINEKTIHLNKTIAGAASATQAALTFSTAYSNNSSSAGSLTLHEDSIIDLGTSGVVVHFASIANISDYILHIFNWEGNTVWSGNPGGGKDQFYVHQNLGTDALNNIRFYSGITESSFLSTGFQIMSGSFQNEIIAVPEPETWATAILLLVGFVFYAHRKFIRRRPTSQQTQIPNRPE